MRKTLITAATAAALCLLPAGANAETFEVTEHDDPAPGSCTANHCTLREAVAAATNHPGDDKVKLPDKGPYVLSRPSNLPGPDDAKGDLDLGAAFAAGDDIRLTHPKPGKAVIDPGPAGDRGIELLDGTATLNRIVVKGGEATDGGGIRISDGVLMLRHSTVKNNFASDDGGGVHVAEGALLTSKSKLRGNDADNGGGIFVSEDGRMTLGETTLTGNEAVEDGGAVHISTNLFLGAVRISTSTIAGNLAAADGGGVFANAADLRIDNSTIADNLAAGRGGGVYGAPDSWTETNGATIARNRSDYDNTGATDSGGGLYGDGGSDVIEARNTLIAKNRATNDAIQECDQPAPVGIESLGGNLIASTAGGCTSFNEAEDVQAANPGIGQLADYGGPTHTIKLKSGSPAVNEADGPFPHDHDQRGHERNDPDIGAFER